MENRRRPKRDNFNFNNNNNNNNNNNDYYNYQKKSQPKKPPRFRGKWQLAVPLWEKQFCKVVGSFDWDTLLHTQKFMHLYENVINWDDSAAEEAFYNAKKRFWAEINGFPCDVPPPNHDLYIDEINWDSETDQELQFDLEWKSTVANGEENRDHDPVVIFGDSLLPNQGYSTTGWGDSEDNFQQVANYSSNNYVVNPWDQNWGYASNNGTATGWPCYPNDPWHYNDWNGYMTWGGGWNNDWGQSYANNGFSYEVGPICEDNTPDGDCGPWNDRVNGGTYAPSYGTPGYNQMPIIGPVHR